MRYGLDHVARSNDSCSFACIYKKASQHTPDAGPFMDGTMVRARALAATTPDAPTLHSALAPPALRDAPTVRSPRTPRRLPSDRPSQTETDRKLRVQAERLDRRRCEDATRRYAEEAKKVGVVAVSVDVLPAGHGAGGGDVAETITAYVASKRADLVVVGSRGIGSLQRSVLTLGRLSGR